MPWVIAKIQSKSAKRRDHENKFFFFIKKVAAKIKEVKVTV